MLQRLLERPERGLVWLCAAQIAFWTLAPALSQSAPPLDVVEMYAWGREGVIATFKHPNGPGLILEAARRITGVAGWPAYFISQLCIAITYCAVFALGRDLMDAKRALAGVLLLTGVLFFSWSTPEFNHNVLQMPFWALIALYLWRASTKGGLADWLLLGLLAGFGLWAKYSSALLFVPAAAWMLWDKQARGTLITPGPYIAAAVAVMAAAPQALWLVNHNFQPLHYAERRSGDGGPLAALEFLATIIADHLPLLVLLLAAGLFLGKTSAEAPSNPDKRAWRYLLLMGLGPLALLIIGGVAGAGLRASWGAPLFNLSGLLAIALFSTRFNDARLIRLAVGAGVLIVLISGLYFGHMRYGAAFTNRPLKGNLPQESMSRGLEAAWHDETGGAPLRIVAGDIWTAGLVGMSDETPPSVLINGDFAISPWLSPQQLAHEGALVVWQEGSPPPGIADLAPDTRSHILLRYGEFPHAPPLIVNYAIIPPGDVSRP